MTTTLDHALFYANQGWKVFPLKEKDKIPVVKWADVATTEKGIITKWWNEKPSANVGIMTGADSNLLVLDIDARHGGEETLLSLQEKYGTLPETPICRTGGGGRHFFFKYADGTKNTTGKLGEGIDTRSQGGYVVGANSLHPNGTNYEWDKSHLPSKVSVNDAPDWLLKILEEKQAETFVIPPTGEGIFPPGQRHDIFISLAGSMRRRGMSNEAIFQALMVENLAHCIPPVPEDHIRKLATGIEIYSPTKAPLLESKDRIQAEWGFVKSVFEWPNTATEFTDVKVSDFGQKELGTFWQQVNSGIDVTTAASNSGILAELEKAEFFQSGRIDGYAKQIKHFGYHAGILKLAETLKHQAESGNTTGVEKAITSINKIPSQAADRAVSIGDAAEDLEKEIREREKHPTDVWGIPYAWPYLSKLTGGKQKGELTLFAGEPGAGKSWMALQDVLYTATGITYDKGNGYAEIVSTPVFYWSGEMKRGQLMKRFYQILGVDGMKMKTGRMTAEDWDLLSDAKALILNSPLVIDDRPLYLHEIMPILKRQKAENGIEQVVFDYESLITAPGKDEIEQSANTSRELKIIAQELDLAITLISSVNKGGMDTGSEFVSKSNVRGSGQKLHDADIVYMLTSFDSKKAIEYRIQPNQYDKTVSLHIKKGRELVGVENGFIPYMRETNSPKFREVTK